MSKLLEYLKLLPKAVKNLDSVIEGIKTDIALENNALPQEEVEIITGRRLICEQCPYMSKNAVKLGLYTTDREDDHCVHCSCNIKWKTSCLTCDCGVVEHNKTNPNNPLKIRWEKIK